MSEASAAAVQGSGWSKNPNPTRGEKVVIDDPDDRKEYSPSYWGRFI
jgi:hypothetical protein